MQVLPSVAQVLEQPAAQALLERYEHDYVVGLIRQVLQAFRAELRAGSAAGSREEIVGQVEERLALAVERGARASLHRVINATGIILHTGLGRAPLSPAALEAVQAVAENYCNLEFDLPQGKRGSRLSHVEDLICAAAQSEAAVVVNNNAAAVLLMINTLARDREVIVSRGELVEIGGSFRIPDIIASSGARIREVGTTNRTHRRDYAEAINPGTALILVVHPSNYKVQGFTSGVGLGELVELSRNAGLPLAYDLGGGVLVDLQQWGLPREPVVNDSLKIGVDLVSFSGDKVLGGPQAGIVTGRREYVEPLAKNPLMRTLRCDKLILAALEASLRLYHLKPEVLQATHPVLRMMTEPVAVLEQRARRLLQALPDPVREKLQPAIEPCTAQAGSGALPLEELPSRGVALRPVGTSLEKFARCLRLDQQSVLGRRHRDRLLLDMRTVRDDEVAGLAAALIRAAESLS